MWLAQHTLLSCADTRDGGPGLGVAGIGLELDPKAVQPFERVGQNQQLGRSVDRAALAEATDEGKSDFQPPMLRGDVQKSRRTGDPAAALVDDCKRQRLSGRFERDCVGTKLSAASGVSSGSGNQRVRPVPMVNSARSAACSARKGSSRTKSFSSVTGAIGSANPGVVSSRRVRKSCRAGASEHLA